MKALKATLLSATILSVSIILSGCWNYREVDDLGIVAGVAVDKSQVSNKYDLSAELVELKGGKEAKTTSKFLTISGDTLFDAARNMIKITGKKLYWSHSKIVVISQDIAKEDMIKVIDWISRDAETRADINVVISKEKTAKELLISQEDTSQINSFNINDIIRNEKNLSKATESHMGKFIHEVESEGISSIVPAFILSKNDSKIIPKISGTAVFKKNNLVGYLNDEESMDTLFILNEIKGGLLIQNESDEQGDTKITLEIFGSKTKVKPVVKEDNVEMNIEIKTTVAIGEVMGSTDYIKDTDRKRLEKDAEKELKKRIEELVKKVQVEYGSDIFGFGAKIKEEQPDIWRQIGPKWEEKFKDLVVHVNPKIKIRNSAMRSSTIKIGENK